MWDVINKTADSATYFVIAAVATTLFIIRLVAMFAGIGHHGDMDVPHDVGHPTEHADSGDSFNLFSLQSILAFFMGLGWMGVVARLAWDMSAFTSAALAVLFGFTLMFVSAGMLFYARKLASTPRVDPRTCVGASGRVYLTIPAKGQGEGQVEVNVSGRRKILQAVSTGDAIASFALVNVVAVDDGNRLVVEPRQ